MNHDVTPASVAIIFLRSSLTYRRPQISNAQDARLQSQAFGVDHETCQHLRSPSHVPSEGPNFSSLEIKSLQEGRSARCGRLPAGDSWTSGDQETGAGGELHVEESDEIMSPDGNRVVGIACVQDAQHRLATSPIGKNHMHVPSMYRLGRVARPCNSEESSSRSFRVHKPRPKRDDKLRRLGLVDKYFLFGRNSVKPIMRRWTHH